jgi:hypothetical protein
MAGPARSEAPKPNRIDLRFTLKWSPPSAATTLAFVASVLIAFTCPWLPNGSSSNTKSLDGLKFYRCMKIVVRKKERKKKSFRFAPPVSQPTFVRRRKREMAFGSRKS